jgi:hypothetical protein
LAGRFAITLKAANDKTTMHTTAAPATRRSLIFFPID